MRATEFLNENGEPEFTPVNYAGLIRHVVKAVVKDVVKGSRKTVRKTVEEPVETLIQRLNRKIFTGELIDTTDDAKCIWWIVKINEEVAGYCSLKKIEVDGQIGGYLARAGVLPAFRGRGLQQKMIGVRLAEAKSRGWPWVVTDTYKGNAASIASLQRMGFDEFKPNKPWIPPAWAKVSKFWKINLAKQEAAQVVDEAPLPPDWDEKQYQPGSSFKSRLAYALDRAKKLGAGSSRVAVTIEYQDRPTVLKIAKNTRGLGQNAAEASVLNDGYARQMGILIPLIDYDKQNPEPTWIQTELAQRASKQQLCAIMKCDTLVQLVAMARAIKGVGKYQQNYADFVKNRLTHKSEQDIETMTEYADKLADLDSQFDVLISDLSREANWGIYQGDPVIIDVGYTSNVRKQYYSR